MKRRSGQVALFLALALVVLTVLALLFVDTFVSVRLKNRLQNAGDAAALAAARRQGELLNEIGRLNVDHIRAALRNDRAACEAIVARQRRLALLGPLEALAKADEAARRNGMKERAAFSDLLREHAMTVRTVYRGGGGAGDPYPEPFPGAWAAYADAIEAIAVSGLAVGPDNVEFYRAASGHLLLTAEFYFAVAGKVWCWFHFNAKDVLARYESWRSWDPLSVRDGNSIGNCEFFSLHVKPVKKALVPPRAGAAERAEAKRRIVEALSLYGERASVAPLADGALGLLADPGQTWFFFEGAEDGRWGRWFDGRRLAGQDGGAELPLRGEVREAYNVFGCAALCRCTAGSFSPTLDASSDLTWSAAAKPFGAVPEAAGGSLRPVTAFSGLVVPAFSDVRLVALDTVAGASFWTADPEWVAHVRKHVPRYLEYGPFGGRSGCFYCRQLVVWENPVFRAQGLAWLAFNSGSCTRGAPPGGGGHGGTRHGH